MKNLKTKKLKALITGITGQDGSYLAEFLISKGYEVHGIIRPVALENIENHFTRIKQLIADKTVELHSGSLENYASLHAIIKKVMPDEIYHLAAQSYVALSFEDEYSTMNTNIKGTHFMLSATRTIVPKAKFYFAASSEMFGKVHGVPQTEETPFHPRSPYGISKVAGYDLTRYYRERQDSPLFSVSGILFNHESPRRGREFVTRKITYTAARIKHGLTDKLVLGNPDAKRDWGFSQDYVQAMWLMLQQDKPNDYVIATGETHTVREFAELAFNILGLDPKKYIVWNDSKNLRPAEVDLLIGDASKAQKQLGWKPKIKFKDLVKMMVEADMELVRKEK